MRLSVAVPAAVLMIASTLLGLGLTAAGQASAERRRAEAVPRTGMEILNAYACGRGETKQILVLGVEDGFSPAGSEPGFIRPGRDHAATLPRDGGSGEYDQVNVDRGFTDSFKVEGWVASGLLVLRVRTLNDSSNDTLHLGSLATDPVTDAPGRRGGGLLTDLSEAWSVEGEVLHARLQDIELSALSQAAAGTSGGTADTLKDYLNDPASPGWLDIFVQDDTAVDFMGLAVCRPPAVRKGASLMPHSLPGSPIPDLVNLTCHHVRRTEDRCEPYVGDTVCSAALPVACSRPGNSPAPVNAEGTVITAWTGGTIAVTEPVRGDRFRTIRDVQKFCAARFGPDWRVANINDGHRNLTLSARGDPGTFRSKVWVDVVNQPHATCWARE